MKLSTLALFGLFVANGAFAKEALDGITFSNFFTNDHVNSKDVVWFACRNIVNNRFLVNKDRTKICWIRNPNELGQIFKGLGITYKREDTVAGSVCPESFRAPEFCDPKKLRDF